MRSGLGGGARLGAASSFRGHAVRRGRPGGTASGNGVASAGRAPSAVIFLFRRTRISPARLGGRGAVRTARGTGTKETTRASVASRTRARKTGRRRRGRRGGLDEGVGASERTHLSALRVGDERRAGDVSVTLSVYACSCASARGRSSAASATVHAAAAIARAISPAGTASRHRSGVGSAPRCGRFFRIAKPVSFKLPVN